MRIAILGNSGSGKSTLAAALAEQHGAATLDLDTIAWEPNQIAVPRSQDEALRDLHHFCESNQDWIVEGCYARLIEATFPYQPELIFLDPGLEKCLAHCKSRPWEPHKFTSKAEQDQHLDFLLNWVRDYYVREGDLSHQVHQALFESYMGPKARRD